MKHINNKIQAVIESLDESADTILIDLLKQKLIDNREIHKSKVSVSDKEIKYAKDGCSQMIDYFLRSETEKIERYRKIETIIANSRKCEGCPNSITGRWDYGTYQRDDIENPLCISCVKWHEKLEDAENEYCINNSECKEKLFDNNDEFFKCKALVNKIKKKLKKIQNETSKH